MRDYQAICDAVLRGDEQAADEAGIAHVQNVRDAIVRPLSHGVAGTGS